MTHYTDNSSSPSTPELTNAQESFALLSRTRDAEEEQRVEISAPPPCNTGAQSASVLIDWLSYTYPVGIPVSDVLPALLSAGWVAMEKGLHGYRSGFVCGPFKVLYDGSASMGCHVILSGQACRALEGLEGFKGWPSFLSALLADDCNVTRLDLAFDDREGLLQKDAIESAIQEGRVVSRYKSCRDMGQRSLSSDATAEGWTRYFGSSMSETMVRIYDKSLEQGITGEHYMRAELQTKNEKGQRLAQYLAARETLEGVGAFLLGLLDFKERGTSEQRTRWDTCSWWSEFLGAVSKARLTVAPVARTIEAVAQWLVQQVAPTLALVMEFPEGARLLGKMLIEGRGRWRSWHKALLPPEAVPA